MLKIQTGMNRDELIQHLRENGYTFNRVQENLIRGGLRGRTATGKRTTIREVTSIDTNVKLNKALWILSEKLAGFKAGTIPSMV